MISTFFILALAALLLGAPIVVALGGASLVYIFSTGIQPMIVIQRLFSGINSSALLAIPFFVLAGDLMNFGGIARRLVDLAKAYLGKFTGSLGTVAIVGCMFFAAISGSGVATAAALGAIMLPEMSKAGYDRTYAGAIIASASPIGIIIPPSITFILYATLVNCSVTDLYIWGIPTGIFVGFCLIALNYFTSKKRGYKALEGVSYTTKQKHKIVRDALWALGSPLIILGGVFGGIVTPTESAVVAVLYSLVVGILVYKELNVKTILQVFKTSAMTTAKIMLIISTASVFSYIMTYERIPQMIVEGLLNITSNVYVVLLFINVVVFIAGMFMESTAFFLVLIPLFWPVVQMLGINVIHFGMIVTVNTAIGLFTPPFGVCMFTAASIGEIKVERLSREVLPFVAVSAAALMVITYAPMLFY